MNLKLSCKLLMTSKRTTAEFSLRQTMFVWRKRNVWCLELIPAELEAFAEAVYDVQADNSRVFFKADLFVWRTRNVWCLELIPAELEPFAEAVYDVQADNSRVFFKADLFVWRTKNVSFLELIPAELEDLLNQHLNVSATMWTVIPVLKLRTKQLFCEDALVLQGRSSFGHWENKMQLQIINNIQRLIRYVLTISKTFRL